MTTKKLSRVAQLAKDLLQYKAMDVMTLFMAYHAMKKVNKDKYMASGVIVTIQNLSGETIVGPFMVQDGLSAETIAAIQADIKATYDHRLAIHKF
jgi:hypothetical protein